MAEPSRQRRYQIKRQEAGLCPQCGQKRDKSSNLCNKCAMKRRLYMRRYTGCKPQSETGMGRPAIEIDLPEDLE